MLEEYLECFHGNRQEIDNEKNRKRELMSYFPKTLGTVDRTRYVLWEDDKPSQTDYFEIKPVVPLLTAPVTDEPMLNIRGTLEARNERLKKDASRQIASQCIVDFKNKENTHIPWNRKDVATILSLTMEKNKAKSPKYSFDSDCNTAKEESNPFNPDILIQRLGAMSNRKLHTITFKNDSLKLKNREVENIADSLKTVNATNYNIVPNNAAIAKPDIKPGLYGRIPKKDYTEELNKLKEQLPPIVASILNNSGTEIVVLDNLQSVTENGELVKRSGRYFADKNKIYLDSKNVNEYTLISELFHAVQNHLGMTGTGKSNLEFQEHVIKDFYFKQRYKKTKNPEYLKGISTTDSDDYECFIRKVFSENGDLDLKYFLAGINSYFDEFQKFYSGSGAYQEPGKDNFNYNWEKIFDLFGIEYK